MVHRTSGGQQPRVPATLKPPDGDQAGYLDFINLMRPGGPSFMPFVVDSLIVALIVVLVRESARLEYLEVGFRGIKVRFREH